mgnify:CR=1 FL=1
MVLRNINNTFLNPNQITDVNELSATRTKKNTLHSITIARYSNKTGEQSCALIAIKMVTLQMATTKAMSITKDNAKPKLQ